MLDIKYIRENKEEVIERLKKRNRDYTEEIERVIELDKERRKTKQELDDVRHQLNQLHKDMHL